MELYIGGCAQGKLPYVLRKYGGMRVVGDAGQLTEYPALEKLIFYPFHEWFCKELKEQRNPEAEMEAILAKYEGLIIISNEVGNGIVPVEAADREYRERLGRFLCHAAERADRVERIICGIGTRIK